MMKNVKRMFFVLTLITLLATVGAVCATDDTNSTAASDSSVSNVATVSETASDTIAAEPITKTSNNKVDTKTIEQEEKNVKKDSITIDGAEYTQIYENQIINETWDIDVENCYINNSTFNNEEIQLGFYGDKESYINNSIINIKLYTESGRIKIQNSILNNLYYNWGAIVIIDDSVTLGPNFYLYNDDNDFNCNGIIYTNNTVLIEKLREISVEYKPISKDYSGNTTIINENINTEIYTKITDNLTFNNCTINAKITNNGNLTLINCSFAKITNNGNLTLINCSFSNQNIGVGEALNTEGFMLNNLGNATLINCIMENNTFNGTTTRTGFLELYGAIKNNAESNLIINNSIFNNNQMGYAIANEAWGRGTAMGTGTVIYNLGTVTISNSNFSNNFAGMIGGAISSHGILNIDNSNFINNSATRRGGAVCIQNGIATITNSNFTHNYIENLMYSDGGEVLGGGAIAASQGNVTIDNCYFDANYADCIITGLSGVWCSGGTIGIQQANVNINNSIFKNSRSDRGGVINNGHAYVYASTTTNITNSVFEDNNGKMGLIYNLLRINLDNNTFINNQNATAIFYMPDSDNTCLANITNNQFINNNMTMQTIYTTQPQNIVKENNSYTNTTINDTLTLDIPNKIFENQTITISGNYTINSPDNYDENILEQNKFNVYINGVLTYTLDELYFDITPTSGNMIFVVQPTISQTRSRNMLTSTKLAVITPENYDTYIYEGELLGISENSQLNFQGNFTDKGEIYINTANIAIDGTNANFTNTTFVLDKNNITIQNMNIKNTNTSYPIQSYQNNNQILNNNINIHNTQGNTAAIYIKASNNIITNNTLKVTGPAGNIDWESDTSGICTTQAILAIESENNTITYNNITVNGTDTGDSFGTIEGITNSRKVNNSLIAYNNINVTGGYFNYAINQLDCINNSTVTENNILVTGFRYADGIQIGDNATNINITKNNITCICLNDTPVDEAAITYGIITTCQGGDPSTNFNILENNINLTGAVNYGMEIYKTTKTTMTNNNITANGNYSMGIGLAHSTNSIIEQNNIETNGNSSTTYSVTEEIQPANVGIKVQQNSDQVTINNNTITTKDANQQDKTIDTDSQQTTITNNQLSSSTEYGQETIKTTQPDTTLENNTIETTTTLEIPEIAVINTPTTITATVTINDETPINGGTITFTVGNEAISQAEVIDGVATATVTFTQEEDATITASYTPESSGLTTSSDEATTIIQAPQTQLNIEDVELTSGETVTLTATVTDQAGNNITGGKVIFKVNGKTVKDTNGKVIYAKVVDGVATVEYTVPDSLAGKDVNITAVYSGSTKYNKESTTITKTVAAQEPTLTITPITNDVQTGSTITLKAKIAAGDKAITTGKIVFKINGKTVKDANGKVIYAKVDANGEVSVDYNLGNLKAGSYTIEATFISPNYDKITSNTTMTVVKA